MKAYANLLGLIGLILTFFGIVSYVGYGVLESYSTVHLLLGGSLLSTWLLLRFPDLDTLITARQTRQSTNLLTSSLLFLAVLVLLNILAARREYRIDMTEAGIFSLSPQAAQIVGGLPAPLYFTAFVEGGIHPEIEYLLENFASAGTDIQVRMIDPDQSPEKAEQAGIEAYGTVRITFENRSINVREPSEESLTNAIIKLTRPNAQAICFIEGQGEPALQDADSSYGYAQARRALEEENFRVESIPLLQQPQVPAFCDILALASPERPLSDAVLRKIEDFLRAGGSAFFLLSPRSGDELAPLLSNWGVTLGKNIVVDEVVRLFEGPTLGLNPLVSIYGAHPITLAMRERTLFPFTRSIEPAAEVAGIITTTIARTAASSWAEENLVEVFEKSEATFAENSADRRGPVSVAVASSINRQVLGLGSGETRIVVFGSSRLADNQNLGQVYNRDLFLNAAAWLANEPDLLSIRGKSIRTSRVRFSEGEATTIFYLSVLVLPELLMILGLAVWWRRSRL